MGQPSVVEKSEVVEQSLVTAPGGVLLGNAVVRLTPLGVADADDLFVALDDERVWASGCAGDHEVVRRTPAPWRG
jgi:hypothetical protein